PRLAQQPPRPTLFSDTTLFRAIYDDHGPWMGRLTKGRCVRKEIPHKGPLGGAAGRAAGASRGRGGAEVDADAHVPSRYAPAHRGIGRPQRLNSSHVKTADSGLC